MQEVLSGALSDVLLLLVDHDAANGVAGGNGHRGGVGLRVVVEDGEEHFQLALVCLYAVENKLVNAQRLDLVANSLHDFENGLLEGN